MSNTATPNRPNLWGQCVGEKKMRVTGTAVLSNRCKFIIHVIRKDSCLQNDITWSFPWTSCSWKRSPGKQIFLKKAWIYYWTHWAKEAAWITKYRHLWHKILLTTNPPGQQHYRKIMTKYHGCVLAQPILCNNLHEPACQGQTFKVKTTALAGNFFKLMTFDATVV